ncbi:MAG: sulfide/dihydroorotate dehydrogenase-like FAD/NAD-binding protein [Candidatus Omnitrophica bacterium]|nr:sulfide/dihydroorotate dehydrogenase-like FAD/NAD-binding protein [Candidatus Omnitrophota bacterium]
MFKIISTKNLAPNVFSIEISAPDIAWRAKPGQFVMLKIDDKGERIPLTIADIDKAMSSIKIIFQVVGNTTRRLSTLSESDLIMDVLGPLGRKTELKHYGTIVAVGGGVGIAELYPVVKSFKELGNKVYTIIGARSRELLILEKELKTLSDLLYITTDDGTYGEKGFVTDVLRRILEEGHKVDLVYAIGPTLMMKKVSDTTQGFKVNTIVNLNPIMVDGTGMCGSCRVTIGGKARFACVDGPEFDAHQVDFDELFLRQKTFIAQERKYLKP